MDEAIGPLIAMTIIAWIVWAVLSYLRRGRLLKAQFETRANILGKIGAGQEMMDFMKSEAGQRMLEPLPTEPETPREVYHRYLRATPPEMDSAETRAYLFRIATNLLHDRLRAKVRRPEAELPEIEPDSGDRPADRVSAHADLARAFKQMTERERQIVWLAYAEGFSHREIGTAMGMKEQSVRPLLHRAKMKMAALLGRPGGDQ